MANATSFNATFSGFQKGYDEMIAENGSNFLNSAVDVWSNVGGTDVNIGIMFTFTLIPFIVMFMVYAQTQKILPATIGLLIATLGMLGFQQFAGTTLILRESIYLIAVLVPLGLAMSAYNFTKGGD